MDKSQSMQIFITPEKSEEEILSFSGNHIGFIVDSSEIEIPNAIGFAQISTYPQGFEQGILITWPIAIDLAVTSIEVARRLAVDLQVSALLEPNSAEEPWLLVHSDGSVINTDVRYLDDGIQIGDLQAKWQRKRAGHKSLPPELPRCGSGTAGRRHDGEHQSGWKPH